MELRDPGYLRPVQTAPVTADQEAAIAGLCPAVNVRLEAAGRDVHPLWGPYLRVGIGHSTDPALRRNASSGGVISAIATHLLSTGQVDMVLQTRADLAEPTGTMVTPSLAVSDVFDAAGSRYAPSAPLDALDDALASGKRIAFVGKPCDVAALRGLAKFDPRVNEQVKLALSFYCAGVPSRTGAYQVLDRLEAPRDQVTAFRYRGDGWPGFAKATLRDGSTRTMSYADSWGAILSKHIQKRCKLCPDGVGSFADIVCADAWETDADGYPLFEEADGTSLVIARTEAGQKILAEAEAAGAVSVGAYDLEKLEPVQPGQVRKRRYLLSRMAAMRVLLRPLPTYSGFSLALNARKAGLKENFRQFLGMLLREANLRHVLNGKYAKRN